MSLPITPPYTPKFLDGFPPPAQSLPIDFSCTSSKADPSANDQPATQQLFEALDLATHPCQWFPLIRFAEFPERLINVPPTVGPPMPRPAVYCQTFDEYAAQLHVPVYTDQWTSLKGFTPTLPSFHSIGKINPEFGKVLLDSSLKKARQNKAEAEVRKKKWWNLVIVQVRDGSDEIFAGFTQQDECPNTIRDVYHTVHMLMSNVWRPVDWVLICSNGRRLDFRQYGDEPAPCGQVRLCYQDGSPLRNVTYAVAEYPLPPLYHRRTQEQALNICQEPADAVYPSSGSGVVLSASRRTNKNYMPSMAVRTRDDESCFMSGEEQVEDWDDYSPSTLTVAHVFPASDEKLVWVHRYAYDPQYIQWQGPYVNSNALNATSNEHFLSTLAMLPHHPANLMTLVKLHHMHFDDFYSYVCPWTRTIKHAIPMPPKAKKHVVNAGHGTTIAGCLDFEDGQLCPPSLPGLLFQASQVINTWNRLWLDTSTVDNVDLMTRVGKYQKKAVLLGAAVSSSGEVAQAVQPRLYRPRQSLPLDKSRSTQPPRARSMSMTSIRGEQHVKTEVQFATLLLPLILESPPTLPFLTCQEVWSALGDNHPLRLSPPWPAEMVTDSSEGLSGQQCQDQGLGRLWQTANDRDARSRDMDWTVTASSQPESFAPVPSTLPFNLLGLQPTAAMQTLQPTAINEDDVDDESYLEEWQREGNFPPEQIDGVPWDEVDQDLRFLYEHEYQMARRLVRSHR